MKSLPHSTDGRRPVRVFFPCTGLGRQRRGFETFTVDCARALGVDSRVELSLFAGAPVDELPARALPNIARDTALARAFARLHGRGPYFTEQASFFPALVPWLVRGAPDVVYYADLALGNLCFHWRRLTNARYRLLYYNGGLTTRPFSRTDFVQQLTPDAFDDAIARGEDPARQLVLPHGVDVAEQVPGPIRGAARASLGLPTDRPILLSVGALNTYEKRTDVLIRELAALPEPRPFVCILGQQDPEAETLRAQARAALGEANVAFRSVPHGDMQRYYRAADLFVSFSLYEAFGLALVEALAAGTPVVAHDSERMRRLMGPVAHYADLRREGEGTHAVAEALAKALGSHDPEGESARAARHRFVHERYAWTVLREPYVKMLERVAALPHTRASMQLVARRIA